MLRRNQQNMFDICGDMVGNRLRWSPCFLLAGDMLGNAPSGSPFLFGHCPNFIRYSVKVADKVSNNLWAFSKSLQFPLGTSQMVSASF
jgi:hypothetical protein